MRNDNRGLPYITLKYERQKNSTSILTRKHPFLPGLGASSPSRVCGRADCLADQGTLNVLIECVLATRF